MQKIMFNDHYGLTNAVLTGRKTQTRRIIPKRTLDSIEEFQKDYYDDTLDVLEGKELMEQYFFTDRAGKTKFKVGEKVAVAQSYFDVLDYYRSLGTIALIVPCGEDEESFITAKKQEMDLYVIKNYPETI